jgi:hypothetical protein
MLPSAVPLDPVSFLRPFFVGDLQLKLLCVLWAFIAKGALRGAFLLPEMSTPSQ